MRLRGLRCFGDFEMPRCLGDWVVMVGGDDEWVFSRNQTLLSIKFN